MPEKLLEAEDLTSPSTHVPQSIHLPDEAWIPVLQHPCDFSPDVFESISLNLIKNPNINSSLLFRADILYDSLNDELTCTPLSPREREEALSTYNIGNGHFPKLRGFDVKRTLLRRMIPRNPQLDKATLQTCLFLSSDRDQEKSEQHVVIYIPHCASSEELPWYHPRVQALAYMHSWHALPPEKGSQGTVSLHYRLYSTDALPLEERLLRTGRHLLTTIHKHGQGKMAGYEKRVHHDQLVSQQRVQDTYTELKRKHATRLCDNWVEQTEPSKHVFEDLGIAAFLIELWKDMYHLNKVQNSNGTLGQEDKKPSFTGFVDIGCGNGVLVDVLRREGYQGWGFDARRRKTWSTFAPKIQEHLKEMVLIPQPLFELHTGDAKQRSSANGSLISHLPSSVLRNDTKRSAIANSQPTWHNGIFRTGTFIISNHADELTPWTPLLASISASPFLAIPCCSHNLSGARFRAPSVFNNQSADTLAPSYFAANVNRCKSVAIAISSPESDYGMEADDDEETHPQHHYSASIHIPNQQPPPRSRPETGDLTALSQKARSNSSVKHPSAYSSLCKWITHLSTQVGYVPEQEILRLPSTRNLGIVGRRWATREVEGEGVEVRMRRVMEIARLEKADGVGWAGRCGDLSAGKGAGAGEKGGGH